MKGFRATEGFSGAPRAVYLLSLRGGVAEKLTLQVVFGWHFPLWLSLAGACANARKYLCHSPALTGSLENSSTFFDGARGEELSFREPGSAIGLCSNGFVNEKGRKGRRGEMNHVIVTFL